MDLDISMLLNDDALEPDPQRISSLNFNSIVRSAAYASDCPIGAFLSGPPSHRRIVASYGMTEPGATLVLEQILENLATSRGGDDVTIINDIVSLETASTDPNSINKSSIRFVSIFHVADQLGAVQGVLVVADDAPHAGLSAAQVYVLRTHAAQVAALLELQILRKKSETEPGKVGRWSDTERLRLLESVVVNANDAVLITDAEPIDLPGPRIVYCNKAFEKTTGYAEAEVLGKTPRILQPSKVNRNSPRPAETRPPKMAPCRSRTSKSAQGRHGILGGAQYRAGCEREGLVHPLGVGATRRYGSQAQRGDRCSGPGG